MLRVFAFLGPLVEAVAVVEQLRWHALHSAEPFGNVLVAHAAIYAGVVVGMVGALAWWNNRAFRGFAAVVALGALVRLFALGVDAWAHASGGDLEWAHDAYRVGLAVAGLGPLTAVGWFAFKRGVAS